MTLANFYTTDIGTLLQKFPTVTERFEGTGERFASTLLGVASLAGPDLLVAFEATAMDRVARTCRGSGASDRVVTNQP